MSHFVFKISVVGFSPEHATQVPFMFVIAENRGAQMPIHQWNCVSFVFSFVAFCVLSIIIEFLPKSRFIYIAVGFRHFWKGCQTVVTVTTFVWQCLHSLALLL